MYTNLKLKFLISSLYTLSSSALLQIVYRSLASISGISSEQYGLYVKCGNSSTQTQSSALHNDWSRSNERWPARPCTIFILRKENALRNAASLLELFMVQLSRQNLLGMVLSSLYVFFYIFISIKIMWLYYDWDWSIFEIICSKCLLRCYCHPDYVCYLV